jgi:carbon-monoxide dehydrogenase medium subunit
MYPAPFEYARAESLQHALELMAEHGEDARPLAGGMSLLPLLKLRLARPAWLVDIGRLDELGGIADDGGALRLGALARHAEVAASALVRERYPLVRDAISVVGDVQVRNQGTVGGSLAHADPAGNWGSVSLALNARMLCQRSGGERWVDASNFFVDAYTTALAPDELLTRVELPDAAHAGSGAYVALRRRVGDFALASAAVQVSLDDGGVCGSVGIGLGAVGLTPIKAVRAEAALIGAKLTTDAVDTAAELVYEAADPLDDPHGPALYRRSAVRALFRRALAIAVRRHNGEIVESSDG